MSQVPLIHQLGEGVGASAVAGGIVYEEEQRRGRWRLRRNGAARIESEKGVLRLCMGPTEALHYSNAELSDGGFDELPHTQGVLELRARFTRLHYGSAGWGFWNYSMRVDESYPVWFIYLNAPGPYPLKGLFAQVGNKFHPVRLLAPLTGYYFVLKLFPWAAPIRIASRKPSLQDLDLTEPHLYRVEWRGGKARFTVDGRLVAEMEAKHLPARVDMWIDNAVYQPSRRDPAMVYRHVTMENREEACIEITG